jgi:hypothetical protein
VVTREAGSAVDLIGTAGGTLRGSRLREAVYGTIVLLSVLAYLDEHPISAGSAFAAVAGSALVLFLAQLYAEVVTDLVGGRGSPGWSHVRAMARRIWPVAAVAVPPLVLIVLSGVRLMSVDTALAVAYWFGAASLGAWGYAAGRATGRGRLGRWLWALASLGVGLVIAVLKSLAH